VRIASLLAIILLIPACNLTFTTSDPSGAPGPQNPFALQIPYDGQKDVWPTNTQFAWGAYPGASSYTLELSGVSDFSTILYAQSNILITSVFLPVSLTHSTTYFWRVNTLISGLTINAAGSPSQFTTVVAIFGPPVQFFLQSPLGITVDRIPEPVFLWSYAEEATSYSFQIDTTDQFTNPIVNLTDLRLTRATCPVLLAANMTYFWRVTAFNSAGPTPSSPPSSTFSTGP
jgi:hypothetical protein